jgi:uncharacterized protein
MTTFLFSVIFFVVLLFVFQHRMIYFPRRYNEAVRDAYGTEAIRLNYTTDQGKQLSFYVPPKTGNPDKPLVNLWVLFGGNGSLALDWLSIISSFPDGNSGFLLVDYPGYGGCEGHPSPQTIRAAAEAAFMQLALHLQTSAEDLELNLGVLGHSLGAAAALVFASSHPVKKVVLVSPFTSMLDMACRQIGIPLCYLLRHNFDNRAKIKELLARANPPGIYIVHGDQDDTIPVRMSRELAQTFGGGIKYQEIPGGNHNTILYTAEKQIFAAMRD